VACSLTHPAKQVFMGVSHTLEIRLIQVKTLLGPMQRACARQISAV
jgi:hypothetical protein